ncbi:MAG TPA: right-handed parallel beta-helix repeat-containing protein, partial [bacterium]|nr:right-handed parallel beta-helix repeat-containing protein [bacterium]
MSDDDPCPVSIAVVFEEAIEAGSGSIHVMLEDVSRIDAAAEGDTVLVAPGTYSGTGNRDIVFPSIPVTLSSEGGPDTCIIDCDGSIQEEHRGFVITGNADTPKIIDGFTVANADVREIGNNYGGAFFITDDSAAIRNCIITDCRAQLGSAVYAYECNDLLITHCWIENNTSEFSGACVFQGSGQHTVIMDTCSIQNNETMAFSIITTSASLQMTNSVIRNNASMSGGSVLSSSTSLQMTNCLVVNNPSGLSVSGTADITGCTIAFNPAASTGIAGILLDTGTANLRNAIVWANTQTDELATSDGTFIVDFSDIDGGYPGAGNLDADPEFAAAAGHDFYLSHTAAGQVSDSPCVNAGFAEALNTCFDTPDGEICMDELTTRTDGLTDSGMVDM